MSIILALCWFADWSELWLRSSEAKKQRYLRENYTSVELKVDPRKRNIFLSRAENILPILENTPGAAAVVQSSKSFLFRNKSDAAQVFEQQLDVFYVTDRFFESVLGEFVWGRGISRDAVWSGRPVAVVGNVLYESLELQKQNRLSFEGRVLEIVGVWNPVNRDGFDANAVFLPLSLLAAGESAEKTYINRFILPNTRRSIEALKKSVDYSQSLAGWAINRPRYSFSHTSIGPGVLNQWRARISPLSSILFFSILALTFYSYLVVSGVLVREQGGLVLRALAFQQRKDSLLRIWINFQLEIFAWGLAAVLLAFSVRFLFTAILPIDFPLFMFFSSKFFVALSLLSAGVFFGLKRRVRVGLFWERWTPKKEDFKRMPEKKAS